jgi:hypothetical protein
MKLLKFLEAHSTINDVLKKEVSNFLVFVTHKPYREQQCCSLETGVLKVTLNKAAVLVVVSFLLVILIYSSVAQFDVFARPKNIEMLCHDATPTIKGAVTAEVCCQHINGAITVCNKCQYDANGKTVGSCINFYPEGQMPGGNSTGPPTNVLPPGDNNPSTLPPGSIIKVPPGTTNAGPITTTGNNTGSVNGTITKVPPGIFKPTGNATNATPPPTLLAKQTSSGHHHHKGIGTSNGNTNSTGH